MTARLAASHGVVSLELAGYEGAVDAEHCYRGLLAAAWFFAPRASSTQPHHSKQAKEAGP
jgi:hypothetical protein